MYDYRRLQSQENVSGTSWPAWFQARLEYHALKDNLLKLTDPADFLKTFPLFLEQAPALRDDPSLLTDDLRLFLVASYALAIEKETPTGQAELSREHALFGLNVLYDLYEDPTHARQLEQLFDVGYPQLADMAAQHPIFGTDPHPPVSEP